MFQVRFHGRGGQGVVTAAELLAAAAFGEGRHAQAFPSFGSERMGAPVMSFCRIDTRPIRTREPVTEPDALVIQDPTLLHEADLFAGLGGEGYVLVNSARDFGQLGLDDTRKSLRRLVHDAWTLPPLSFLDLDHGLVDAELTRMRTRRRSGPSAENMLRDLGVAPSAIGN